MRSGWFRILAALLCACTVWAVTSGALGGNLLQKVAALSAAFLFFSFAVFGHSSTFVRIEEFFLGTPRDDEDPDET